MITTEHNVETTFYKAQVQIRDGSIHQLSHFKMAAILNISQLSVLPYYYSLNQADNNKVGIYKNGIYWYYWNYS